MSLTLKVLNPDSTLNNFSETSNAAIVKGADAVLMLQLFQSNRKLRYIPDVGFTASIDFLKADGTTLTKAASLPFADDRSVLQFTLSDTETLNLISQNLVVELNEGSDVSFAILKGGLQMVSTTSLGC